MSSRSIYLTRLSITGGISLSTPVVVIKEIADAHAISYQEDKLNETKYITQLINSINTTNVNIIKEPYEMKDYKLMARFVNKNYQWKKSVLIQGFNFLLQYNNLDKIMEVNSGFKFGPQTPEHPDSLNACVLYAICKVNRIDTNLYTTINEMASNIALLFSLKIPDISHSIRTTIYDAMTYGGCENYQLVNMLRQIDPEKSFKLMNIKEHEITPTIVTISENARVEINYDDLNDAANNIRLRTNRTYPRTHIEAVAMAAIYYNMDISEVKNPLAEYQELTRTPYFPIDRELAKRIQSSNLNPDSILNPRLDKNFNALLPYTLYNDDDLNNLCREEGYSNTEILDEGAYTLLQSVSFFPTFVHGKQILPINEQNTMLDDYNDLTYHEVILYGVKNGTMRFYTYSELKDTFNTFKRFQRPDGNNDIFAENVINKLYLLCKKDQRVGETIGMFNERTELADEIDWVRLYLNSNHEQVRQFISKYDMLDNSQKDNVNEFMRLLMESAMYMRGWIGQGEYPISANQAVSEAEEQPNIELRVTESIQRLDNSLEELGEMGEIIKQLPLMFYHYRNNELLPSTNPEEGMTIYERINIVKGGENGSIQSCIRMSSNRFASSAYYYMKLLSIPVFFDISELSHIQ